jgi:Ca2+-binding EF-hand superfamily protein
MSRMDADGDGKLSLAEMSNPERGDKMFARLDKDGNGTLSAEEFAEMRMGMRGHGGKKPKSE